jgi:hypothetical protein
MRTVKPFVLLLPLLLPAFAASQEWSIRPEHPRLLIHRDELAGLRKRCGVAAYRDGAPTSAPFASQQDAFERVRRVADRAARVGADSGELYALALAHLVLGDVDRRDKYVERVESELRRELEREWQQDDVIIALDWCWDALRPDVRNAITSQLTVRLKPLSNEISPLDHVVFHPRICDAAAAITMFDPQAAGRGNAGSSRIREILSAAAAYLEDPFVRLWQQKGPAPSSPTNEIRAEADAALAAEIWQTGTGRALWPRLAESLGRSAEVHFWSYTGHASLRFGFPWNDGNWAPDRPGLMPENWPAAVPWVIAARTGSGTARWFTDEFPEAGITGATARDEAPDDRLAWSRVLYGGAPAGVVLRQACPLGRRIPQGFVMMRSNWSPDAVVVMADVGQPYWRSRQHYGTGHFQIFRSGRLTTGSCEDVMFDAAPARAGDCSIGTRAADWDFFAQATIAHNCLTILDPQHREYRFRRPWLATGNQRIIEQDYRLTDPPIEETNRIRGRLVAFETNSFYTYAAADLALAYPGEVVRSYVRHFLLLNAGALFVCDRVSVARSNTDIAWHLQLPERPRVGGKDLREGDRTGGASNTAGIWTIRGKDEWVDVTQTDGRLFVQTLLPGDARRQLIGGPKEAMTIPRGRWAGRFFFGSSPKGYEYRLWPAQVAGTPQAWYRLGEPRSLGPQFGLRSNWGRLDVSPAGRGKETAFLHVLVPTEAQTDRPPQVESTRDAHSVRVTIALSTGRCETIWNLEKLDGGESAGKVSVFDPNTGELLFQNELAASVTADKPIPGERP